MKVLIGAPIHQIKDYSIERWLENVSKLEYSADLLMVDGSPGKSFLGKVRNYCAKYGIKNYKMEHLEINQEQGMDEIIGRSREIIRQYVLSNDYDAWFSWECEKVIPPNALCAMVRMMENDDFTMIHQNFGATRIPIQPIARLDCALVKRQCLEKYGFLLERPNMPNTWHAGENWFKKQILQGGGNYIEVYGDIKPKYKRRMKVLIGAPIHQVKDYSMERWLENVSKIRHPADLLMVDNSPGLDFVKKVKKYCQKLGLKNYKLAHIEVPPEFNGDRRVEMSQEVIRQYVLSHNYDAWFSWECDQLIPSNALYQLINMMNAGSFWMVNHNCWVRGHPGRTNTDFGVSLIKSDVLKKYSFLLEYGFYSDWPEIWEPGEVWIKKQVLKGGGNALEVEGVINPIYHLEK